MSVSIFFSIQTDVHFKNFMEFQKKKFSSHIKIFFLPGGNWNLRRSFSSTQTSSSMIQNIIHCMINKSSID